jgi:hypothetical protein
MKKAKIINLPERIYLNSGMDEEDFELYAKDGIHDFKEWEEVTWCEDKIFDHDIEYKLVKRRRKELK